MTTNSLGSKKVVIKTFINALNVPGQWFTGQERDDGSIELLYVGEDFVWSFLVTSDGNYVSSEADLGPFSTVHRGLRAP